ncbi:hypothetical protein [Clostridium magnum]|uniref:Uncharacterized protein n=1 Tax=Clostridium magnum DSM 2767 TaxID=1121326 RepID=A0A162RVL9_9CLOT|nr:hypothetical protein [Clostridium magnum]KZL90437.1 hypothetical protein CLMAG_42080 [Clostridium magnum DSM 2767]SHH85124.1 hypothetical protein SAMN02745944_01585 [Clostridium magnum DSM 2767]
MENLKNMFLAGLEQYLITLISVETYGDFRKAYQEYLEQVISDYSNR